MVRRLYWLPRSAAWPPAAEVLERIHLVDATERSPEKTPQFIGDDRCKHASSDSTTIPAFSRMARARCLKISTAANDA